MNKLTIIFACVLPAALAACGGGGGNGAATFSPPDPHHPTNLTREPAVRSTVEQIAQTDTGNNAPGDSAQSQGAPANATYDVRKAMKSLYMKGYYKHLRISSGNFDSDEHRAPVLGTVTVEVNPPVKYDETKFNVGFAVTGLQIFMHGKSTYAQEALYSNTYDTEMLLYETSTGTHDCSATLASGYPTAAKAGEYGTLADLVCRKHGGKMQPIVETQQLTYTTSANPSGGLNFDVTRQTRDHETDAKDTITYKYLITANGVAELTGVRLKYSQPGHKSYDVTAH